MMALERVLGTALVERTTRHLSLTESGPLYSRTGQATRFIICARLTP